MRKLLGAALLAGALAAAAPALAADSPVGQKECQKQGGTYLVREFPPPGYQCHDATVNESDLAKAQKECEKSGGTFAGPSPEQKPTYTCTYF